MTQQVTIDLWIPKSEDYEYVVSMIHSELVELIGQGCTSVPGEVYFNRREFSTKEEHQYRVIVFADTHIVRALMNNWIASKHFVIK